MTKRLSTPARLAILVILSVGLYSCSSSDGPTEPTATLKVAATFPADGATDVPVDTDIWARFSAPVDPNSFTAGQTFRVINANGSWSTQSTTATFVVDGLLETDQTYTITLTTGVTSTTGNPLASPHTWSFTTEAEAVVRPSVVSVKPADGATGVDPAAKITATFDRMLDPATVVAGQSFVVAGVMGSVLTTDSVAVFTPDEPLPNQTSIAVTLTTAIQDTSGAAMASPFDWSFETAAVIESWEQAYGLPTYPFREKTYFGHVAADGGDSYYGFGVDNREAFVVKTDVQGEVVWSRTFGPAVSYTNEAFVVLSDGCLFAYTNEAAGVEVVSLDGNGTTQVETTISEVGTMRIYDMIETGDGNYVMAGVNLRTENTEPLMTFWSAKIDANANVLWQHAYADSVEIDEVTGIVETPNDDLLMIGSNWGLDGRGIATRMDAAGTRLWIKRIEGDIVSMTPYSIVPATDGGYVVAGSDLLGSRAEGFVAKMDEDANIVWSYLAGDDAGRWEEYMMLQDVVAVPGGYVAAGHDGPTWREVDALLVMFDLSGNILWEERIGGPRNEYVRSVTALSTGEFLGAGYTNAFSTNIDYYQAYMFKHVPAAPLR